MFSLIHFTTAGSAYRLSTGMSKKPCKYPMSNVERLNVSCGDCCEVKSEEEAFHNLTIHHLDLAGMEVHGDDVVGTSDGEHVGDQLRTDRGSALVLLVLPDHENDDDKVGDDENASFCSFFQ